MRQPRLDDPTDLLTVSQMRQVDAYAIASGVPGRRLMDRAGAAVAREALAAAPDARRAVVLCGPGANGGDGYVAAGRLAAAGLDVRIFSVSRPEASSDAGRAAADWPGSVSPLGALDLQGADLVVDALFGAGLSRDLDGAALAALEAAQRWRQGAAERRLIAVDVPSGVDGDTGEVRGGAAAADVTVTFFRRKPGHCLLPGRSLCGRIVVADIGVPPAALAGIAPRASTVGPALWRDSWPGASVDGHKYTRGHCLVVGGGALRTGAGRLAARAALRVGAGLVTFAAPQDALPTAAAHLTAVMLAPCDDASDLGALLADPRRNALVLGPAGGVGERMQSLCLAALASSAACVLDADALTSFAGEAAPALFDAAGRRSAPVVLTPHEGEFARLFGAIEGSKLDRTRAAALRSGAVVALKGPDTVVASPDGRAALLDFDSPWLATAGSGDVLAGFVGGLLAQGVPAFEAASAAVWIHAQIGRELGAGLIAEDLPDAAPRVLRRLFPA